MLLMLARLGLRAGEVAALRLDDVDWRAGEIDIPGKGGRRERLPLPDDVGQSKFIRSGLSATDTIECIDIGGTSYGDIMGPGSTGMTPSRWRMADSIGRCNTPTDVRCCGCGRRRN